MIYGGHFEPDKKELRIKELESEVNKPDFWNDTKHSNEVINELNYLKKLLNEVSILKDKISSNLAMLSDMKDNVDNEIKDLVEMELEDIKKTKEELEVSVLLSGDYDKEDALVEIHPGAGGTESCDWASMLYRMYTRWCSNHDYKCEIIDLQDGDEAGIKSVTLKVSGLNAYGYLKCEKGVHRLVRISPFDSNSRRHTSFASVLVTPYFKDSEIKIDIDEKDLKIDTYRSSGAGGQHVNKTESAIRITHLPTGIIVACQDERSQIKNRERAMSILKSKLYDLYKGQQEEELKKERRSQVGTGDRSERVRTYNYPQGRVTDHRVNLTSYNLEGVLNGDIDQFIEALAIKDRADRLQNM